MNHIKQNQRLNEYLARRHAASDEQIYVNARSQFKGSDEAFGLLAQEYESLAPDKKGAFLKDHDITVQDADLSLAVSQEMGDFLFNLVLLKKPKLILELGSSNGVSTMYFAEALRLAGGGRIIATEKEAGKCEGLRRDLRAMELLSFVDVREGDVFETVKDIRDQVDMLFVDIWASAYLDIFKAVEHLLAPGAIVLADNMYTSYEEMQGFRSYLDSRLNISNTTLCFESGVEFAIVV